MINLKNKKILVTGAHGFLGKHLVKNLLEKRKVFPKNLFTPSSKELDLTIFKNCQKAVKGRQIVIHLAGVVGGIGANAERPGEFFYKNAIMGIQLMETARQAGVEKFVALGTICCYPKFAEIPFREKDVWNGYPEETNASYGLAKKMLLVQSQSYRQQYGFNSIFLMPVNIYGPFDNFDPKSSHVIPAIILKIYKAIKTKKKYVEVWGTGRPTREFLHVEDGAEAILLAAEKYNRPDPVNIGSGDEISIRDLVELISSIMGFKGRIIWNKKKPDGQPRRKLDTRKAQKEFGFKAKIDFRKGLEETINWFLQNYD